MLATIIIGAPLGAFWGVGGLKIQQQAMTWSQKQYIDNYENWKSQGLGTAGPLGTSVFFTIVLMVFVSAYEPLKRGIEKGVGLEKEKGGGPVI